MSGTDYHGDTDNHHGTADDGSADNYRAASASSKSRRHVHLSHSVVTKF